MKDAKARNVRDRILSDYDNLIRLRQRPCVPSGGCSQSTASAIGIAITASGQAPDKLVPPVGGQKPETSGTPPHKAAPQDHSGLTGVLSEVATRLQNAESLLHVVAAQRKADRETRGWYRLLQTAQWLILAASTSDGLTIPSAPPPSIHRFLNA